MSGQGRNDAGSAATVVRLTVPDLGLAGTTLSLSLWLVPEGSEVVEGDRVVELLAAGVTIDLAAPASGLFARALVDEDDVVFPGAVLAEFVVALDAGGRDE